MILQAAATPTTADASRLGLYALYIALVDFGYLVWLTVRVKSGFDQLNKRIADLENKR